MKNKSKKTLNNSKSGVIFLPNSLFILHSELFFTQKLCKKLCKIDVRVVGNMILNTLKNNDYICVKDSVQQKREELNSSLKTFLISYCFFFINWSGQWDLNPRHQPWQNFKFTANLNHSNDSQI